jgi:hypothetical protein
MMMKLFCFISGLTTPLLPGFVIQQFRRFNNAGNATMISSVQFFAVNGTETIGKTSFQNFRAFRCSETSRVERTAKPVRRMTAAKWLQTGDGNGRVAGNFMPGMEHGLGAIQAFGRLPKNF